MQQITKSQWRAAVPDGARLREYRQAAQLTQVELANLIGTNRHAVIGHWENNRNLPSNVYRLALARVLGIDIPEYADVPR